MERELTIDANRLFGAADALLAAMGSKDGKNTLVAVRMDDPSAPGGLHPTMRAYTPLELSEAMSMLERLGLVPRPESGPSPEARHHRRS